MTVKVLNQSIQDKDNFYNVRIFAVFDENELESKFVKTNIRNYITEKDIEIFQNKYMDFFSFDDFIKIVKMYIEEEAGNLKKTVDCCYNKKYTLLDIAKIINNLDNHKVNTTVLNVEALGSEYTGVYCANYKLNYKGLENSIKDMFKSLKTKYSSL